MVRQCSVNFCTCWSIYKIMLFWANNSNKVNLYTFSEKTLQIYSKKSTALLEKSSMLGQCQIIYQVMYNEIINTYVWGNGTVCWTCHDSLSINKLINKKRRNQIWSKLLENTMKCASVLPSCVYKQDSHVHQPCKTRLPKQGVFPVLCKF